VQLLTTIICEQEKCRLWKFNHLNEQCFDKNAAQKKNSEDWQQSRCHKCQSVQMAFVGQGLLQRCYEKTPGVNVTNSLVQGSDVRTKVLRYQDRTFTGTRPQVWPDALPAVTNSCRHQRLIWLPAGIEPRFTGCKSIALTTEPRLLPIRVL